MEDSENDMFGVITYMPKDETEWKKILKNPAKFNKLNLVCTTSSFLDLWFCGTSAALTLDLFGIYSNILSGRILSGMCSGAGVVSSLYRRRV